MKTIPTYKEASNALSAAKSLLTAQASYPTIRYNLAADMGLILKGLYEQCCSSGKCQVKDDILIAEFLNAERVCRFEKYCKTFFTLCNTFTIDLHYNFYARKIEKKNDGTYSVAFTVIKELA